MTFNINNKEIKVDDTLAKEFTETTGYGLNDLEIKSAILSAYAGDFMKGEDSPSLEEIFSTRSITEIEAAIAREFKEEMSLYE